MSRESLVILLGVVVTVTPWLGVPREWRTYALLGAGLLLIFLGYTLRRAAYFRRIERADGDRGTDVFVEGRPDDSLHEASVTPTDEPLQDEQVR